MDITALRQRPQWLILSTVILAAAIGGALRIFAAPTDTAQAPLPEVAEPAPAIAPTADDELFESPMVALSAELQKAALPSELVNSTTTEARLSVVATGRVDPFAPITQTIGVSAPTRRQGAAATPSAGAATVPTTAVTGAQDLPPVPQVNFAPPALPPIPVAASPVTIPALPSNLPQLGNLPQPSTNSAPVAAPLPQDPLQAIQLTGVVQVGNRVGVIVREGAGQTSRHLFEGDLLAGGIRIKAIDLSAQEPLVILEYQGREYSRMVG